MALIAAGVTLYEPDIDRAKQNITSLLAQTQCLYIVDNASSNTAEIRLAFAEHEQVRYIENSANEGIARALNQMCAAAYEDGYEWILTMDQDSLPEPNLIEKYSRYLQFEDVGIITPIIVDENEPQVVVSATKAPYEYVHRCNTSASLTRLSAWKEVGGFDEKMFIDCVDFDFCASLEEAGYRILRDNEAIMYHRLGYAKEVRFFIPIGRTFQLEKIKKPFFTYNHSPLRTYYYARNQKYFVYKHRGSLNLKTERRVYFQWVVLKLLFEKQKLKKLAAIIRGRYDGAKMVRRYKEEQKQADRMN